MLRMLRSVSIAVRLPFWIGVLLLVVIVTLAAIAYQQVRTGSLTAARTRLDAVATQLATSNVDSYRRRVAAFTLTARNDSIVRFAASPLPALAPAARRVLELLTADTTQVISTAITDTAGRARLAVGDTARAAVFGAPPLHAESTITGPLVLHDTSLAFATSAPVVAGGRRAGYLLQWRQVQTSSRQREVINQFIGGNAAVYFGATNGLWVDLAGQRVTPPPADLIARHAGEFDRPGQGVQLAAVQPIQGTPWLMEVDFSRAGVLAPLHAFMRRLAVAAALLLLLGIIGGWAMSRRIVQPLFDLSHTAETIASGDLGRRARGEAGDEIGRLTRSFNQMADRVQADQQELERRVAERTGELETANRALADAQDALVRKERLALLGQLSSSVGHELRNPLGVMNNAVYYLEAVLADAPATAKEYLGILRQQIAISSKIVTDLMDFARVRRPDRQVVPLEALLTRELETCPPGVTVRRELSPDVPAVLADPVHAEQIVRNLASNACQAMEHGGILTIRTGRDGPGNVKIEVTDTGPGIPPENLDKIFEPLFTTRARGIGLGLAVARTLADANGGSLSAANTPGAGATFTLVLQAPDTAA